MNCKLNTLKVLGGVADLRANYRISQFLAILKTYIEKGEVVLTPDGEITDDFFEKAFEVQFFGYNGEAMDIERMAGGEGDTCPLDTIICDLMMYKSDDLFMGAMSFMTRRFGQRRALANFLPQVTLLSGCRLPIFEDFLILNQDLDQLRFYTQSYEVWAVQSASAGLMNERTFDSVCEIIDKIIEFIYSPSVEDIANETRAEKDPRISAYLKSPRGFEPDGVDKNSNIAPSVLQTRTPNEHHQNLLRNMGLTKEVLFHGLVIELDIMDKLNKMASAPDSPALSIATQQSYDWLFVMSKKIVFCLAAFVRGNSENQKVLFASLDLLRSKMGVGLFVWDAVIDIFKDNVELAEMCPRALFFQFAELLNDSIRSIRHIEFFCSLIEPVEGGRTLARNQNLGLLAVTDRKFTKALLLKLSSKPGAVSENDMLFHIHSIHFLGLASKEQNSTTGAKCQSLLSLAQVEFKLNKLPADQILNMKLATVLINFTNYVFVDTPLLEQFIAESPQIWSILRLSSEKACNIWHECDNRDLIEEEELLVTASLSLLYLFFKNVYQDESADFDIRSAKNKIEGEVAYISKRPVNNGRQVNGGSKVLGRLSKLAQRCQNLFVDENADNRTTFPAYMPSFSMSNIGEDANHHHFRAEDEGSAYSHEKLSELMKSRKNEYIILVANALLNSKKTLAAVQKKDKQFIDVLESVSSMADPSDKYYLEAATGSWPEEIVKGLNEEERALKDFKDRAAFLLETLLGFRALVVLLTLIFFAAAITFVQFFLTGVYAGILEIVGVLFSAIFITELLLRIVCWNIVRGELDSFFFDRLNLVDVFVVAVDVILLFSSGSEGDVGGLVKALRLARLFRLLRLYRASTIKLESKREINPISKDQAVNDPRSVKIEFKDLCIRFLTFLDAHHNDSSKDAVLLMTMDIMIKHLQIKADEKDNVVQSAAEKLIESIAETEEKREQTLTNHQNDLINADPSRVRGGAAGVIIRMLSESDSSSVIASALTLGKCLVEGENLDSQLAFQNYLRNHGKGGYFWIHMRDRIRDSCAGWKSYQNVVDLNKARAQNFAPDCEKSVLTFEFLAELCGGHNKGMQDFIRVQSNKLKTFNLVEEALELLAIQGKHLPTVRKYTNFEASLALSTLRFLVAVTRGPSEDNQLLFARSRKAAEVCRNILSSNFTSVVDDKLKWGLYASSMAFIAALLESRGAGKTIHEILVEQLPVSVFHKRIVDLNTFACVLGKEAGGEDNQDLIDDLTFLLEDETRSILTIMAELGLEKEEQEGMQKMKEKDEEEFGERKIVNLRDNVRSVEVYWNGKSVQAFFTLPPVWRSLSEASKANFYETADIDNQESRTKSLMSQSDDLYEEMLYQDKLSTFRVYMWFAANYFYVKYFAYCVIILLNFSVMLSTIDELDHLSVYADLGTSGLKHPEHVTIGLAILAVILYIVLIAYLAISYAPLVFKRSERIRTDMVKDDPGVVTVDSGPFVIWGGALLFGLCFGYIHFIQHDYPSGNYLTTGWYVAWTSAPFILRACLICPSSRVLKLYCAAYDTFCYPPLRDNLLLIIVLLIGMNFSYLLTFALLDIISMSDTLKGVIRSITRPISQLVQTFGLFLIVIACYTAIAFYAFGPNSFQVETDPGESKDACTTLLGCFVYSLYVGMRNGDMAEVLADNDPDEKSIFRNRVIYDLSFFIILGVLLFDMVSGIILDTFGALREEIAERHEKMSNETFMSGLTRSGIDDIEGNVLDFNSINDDDQNVWNYVFFIIYLRNRDPETMNGLEAYARARIDDGEAPFPIKTSRKVEIVIAEIAEIADEKHRKENARAM